MKAELRLSTHATLPDGHVIEVWYGGEFIAAVYGADGPGVRVISKYDLVVTEQPLGAVAPHCVDIEVSR
jgi:hypothetical protein